MTRHPILTVLCLAVLGTAGGCIAPVETTTASTPAAAAYTPDGTTIAPFPGPEAPVETPTSVATDPAAPTPTADPVATGGTQPAATAPKTTAKPATTKPATTKTTTAAPPPPPATTVKPSGPGTVTLKCFPQGGGLTRVSLTWTNPGFAASVTANGVTYSDGPSGSTGLGASVKETTPGHGTCSGSVGGVSKSGSY